MSGRSAQAFAALALVWLLALGSGCGRQNESPGQIPEVSGQQAVPAVPAPEPEPAYKVTDVNLAATDQGGGIEELTDVYGPGFLGRRLIDGLLEPTWKAGPIAPRQTVTWPQEAVFSFRRTVWRSPKCGRWKRVPDNRSDVDRVKLWDRQGQSRF